MAEFRNCPIDSKSMCSPTKLDLAERLSQIFRLVLGLPDDANTSKIRRINEARWDSLANVTLVTAMESEFGVTLNSEEIERLTSYQAALLLLLDKRASDD